ncbi:gastrula zinc finger protein XlCGF48.2-like [Ischnura elegans]|uniref:gastrula zinc finger protein XlCGF48.2-like n=1 Tax=Ischnura elegans TaxID=197161 RepID=UPI001ED899D4|nr:gastrula zinc finger protein XlCGF48.2-like [Ischnura elegans]
MSFPKNLRLCRLCLHHKDSFVDIHEQSDRYGFVVVDEINELLQLNVTPGDGLPEGICYDCLYDLSHFRRFKKVSHEAEITLKYILSHDGENGQMKQRPEEAINDEPNNYGDPDVDPLLDDLNPIITHSESLRREIETNSYDGDTADDTNVALMCEATLSEVDENLSIDKGMEAVRRSIKVESSPNSSSHQGRELSHSVFSIVREQGKSVNHVKNESSSRSDSAPHDNGALSSGSNLKCSDCLTVFPDEYSFRFHQANSECAPLYICSLCDASFMNNVCLMEHHMTCHADAGEASDAKDHKLSMSVNRGYNCNDCGSWFRRQIILEHHKVKYHAQKLMWNCGVCKKAFLTKGGLKEHLVVHSTERPFVCEICGSAFKLRKKLLRHVRNCHSEK